ncbi:cytochrome P450 [Streptomyces sp. NBC_00365]|uniref:cytochrome P450 n=1 Tax=Streptomyces sp. NBC_00365 TaxID=2975726 RepID=UPI00225861EC|nr:cytochrome P450 [Streptomyces sp. NBC_00365]MCX5096729.1 cytochrome P450 [Streptomyces sp. NBC_00365]
MNATTTYPEFRFGRMQGFLRGPAVRGVSVDGAGALFVTDPALVRRILVNDSKDYGKGELFQKARNLSRAGILAEDESVHRYYRRLAHPYLRSSTVDDYAPVMREIAHGTVSSWRTGQTVDIQAEMCRTAGAVALRTLLHGLPPKRSAALTERLARLSWEMIRKPLYGKAAARAERRQAAGRLLRAREDFRGELAATLIEQMGSARPAAGYLSALLPDLRTDAAPALTLDQVCDEAVMMLAAGTVTTASVLSWALYVLSQEPLIEEKVLKDMAGDGGASAEHGGGHCPAGYTVRFLTEVLRLYPPVWITCRRTLADVTLGENALPAGTHVLFSSYLLHRNPERYPDPYRFDPDRWLSLRPAAGDSSFIPFGVGAKGCIGESFAWKELDVVLGAVIQEWQLSLAPGSRIRKAPETTLHPRSLLMVPRPR